MVKISRDYIIEKAFEQYLQLGYSGVSISVLQQKLGIGRASLYYYFKTKEELFEAVLNRYFVTVIDKNFAQLNAEKRPTIDFVIDGFVELYRQLYTPSAAGGSAKEMSGLTSLLLYATRNNADFADLVSVKNRQAYRLWLKALKNGILDGQVRSDIDLEGTAMLFISIKTSYELGDVPEIGQQAYRKAYTCLYHLLSVKST